MSFTRERGNVSRVGYFALCIMIRIQLILVEWKSRNITKCYVMQASWWILPITFKIKKCEWTTVQPWFNDELKDWPNFVYHDEILLHRDSVPLFYNNWGREQCLLYQGFHHNYRGSLYQRSTVMLFAFPKNSFITDLPTFFEYPKKTQH